MAVEEGARACEAARARAGPPAPPRAGDGRALARPRAGGGCQQSPPGSARRATGARPGGDRVANEVLSLVGNVDVDRFELAAADARRTRRRRPTVPRSRCMAVSSCPRTATTTGRGPARGARGARRRARAGVLRVGPTDGPFGLPADTSSFVGRERELAELRSLLGQTRLLTLCGTGGAGKTRLALELARGAEPAYAEGAALVELAELTDPRLVPDAVAASLDLRALPGQDLVDAVIEVPRAAHAAARPRQLRARARRERRARRRAAARGAAGHDRGDEPRAAARARRGRVPRSVAGHSRPGAGAPAH